MLLLGSKEWLVFYLYPILMGQKVMNLPNNKTL